MQVVVNAEALFAELERAWNAADGSAFAAPFDAEVDFVDVRGTHHRGDQRVVAAGHQAIFDTIYKGSTVSYDVAHTRMLTPQCAVALVRATLDAPVGPLQGVHHAVITAVIVERDGAWRIAAFHNTLVADDPAQS